MQKPILRSKKLVVDAKVAEKGPERGFQTFLHTQWHSWVVFSDVQPRHSDIEGMCGFTATGSPQESSRKYIDFDLQGILRPFANSACLRRVSIRGASILAHFLFVRHLVFKLFCFLATAAPP